jgi:hypothetical protein
MLSFNTKMNTMEKKLHYQIVITTEQENEKQKLPLNLIIPLAAGAIAGVAGILGIFWGIEILMGL